MRGEGELQVCDEAECVRKGCGEKKWRRGGEG